MTLVLASALLVCPKEYHIDCSGWNGVAKAEFDVRVTAVDGTAGGNTIVLEPGSTPEQVRGILRVVVHNDCGFWVREVGKNVLVVEGRGKSPIRSVEFKSEGWKPAVRVVFKAPDKK